MYCVPAPSLIYHNPLMVSLNPLWSITFIVVLNPLCSITFMEFLNPIWSIKFIEFLKPIWSITFVNESPEAPLIKHNYLMFLNPLWFITFVFREPLRSISHSLYSWTSNWFIAIIPCVLEPPLIHHDCVLGTPSSSLQLFIMFPNTPPGASPSFIVLPNPIWSITNIAQSTEQVIPETAESLYSSWDLSPLFGVIPLTWGTCFVDLTVLVPVLLLLWGAIQSSAEYQQQLVFHREHTFTHYIPEEFLQDPRNVFLKKYRSYWTGFSIFLAVFFLFMCVYIMLHKQFYRDSDNLNPFKIETSPFIVESTIFCIKRMIAHFSSTPNVDFPPSDNLCSCFCWMRGASFVKCLQQAPYPVRTLWPGCAALPPSRVFSTKHFMSHHWSSPEIALWWSALCLDCLGYWHYMWTWALNLFVRHPAWALPPLSRLLF